MSGYGRGEAVVGGSRLIAEIRTVNHRFCLVSVRLPTELSCFEDTARRKIRERVRRGKVDLTASIESTEVSRQGALNQSLAQSYVDQLRRFAQQNGIADDVDLATLANLPGVIGEQDQSLLAPERREQALSDAVDGALSDLKRTRREEGARLAADLEVRFAAMAAGTEEIATCAGDLPDRIRAQLHDRLEELLVDRDGSLDQQRLAQEVVYYADRADITEELVRLRSHLEHCHELLTREGAVGRKLEFLAQELHRELSTLGSKARDLDISVAVVELKSQLERVREQVQNIE